MANLRMPTARLPMLLCATAVVLCGCGSIAGRGDSRFYPGVYPGVQNLIHCFAHPAENDVPIWPLGIIDFPFSAALDTALLPGDLPYWVQSRTGRPCSAAPGAGR